MTASGTVPETILQVHPSRHCNLACGHCYSASGPSKTGSIGISALRVLFEDAAAEGYGILSLSGGEPLMDPAIFDQIEAAREAGLRVHLVTNGTVASDAKARRLAGLVDLVAVSIDGPPDLHDALRGRRGAFDRALDGLRTFRRAGLRIALIHTVRLATLPHLRWLARLAYDEGAAVLQLHPLEASGRARSGMPGEAGAADLPTRLAILAAMLSAEGGTYPPIHVDVLAKDSLAAGSACGADGATRPEGKLAAWIDPLVVEPDGAIVPWTYGIRRDLAVGMLDGTRPGETMALYRETGLPRALSHLREVRDRILLRHPWPYVNWFAALAEELQPAD